MKKKNRTNRAKPTDSATGPMDRRTFVKVLPTLAAAGLATSVPTAAQTQAPPDQASPITADSLRAAEQIMGVELTQPQEAMALNGVRRNLGFIPAVEYIRAQRARLLLMKEMDKLMSGLDVLVTPAPGSRSLLITNFTGHPAVVTPCGFISGRPQALMFTSGLYDEAAALQAAMAFEDATDWHNKHPKVDWS